MVLLVMTSWNMKSTRIRYNWMLGETRKQWFMSSLESSKLRWDPIGSDRGIQVLLSIQTPLSSCTDYSSLWGFLYKAYNHLHITSCITWGGPTTINCLYPDPHLLSLHHRMAVHGPPFPQSPIYVIGPETGRSGYTFTIHLTEFPHIQPPWIGALWEVWRWTGR